MSEMTLLAPLPAAITQTAVQAATAVYPADYVIEHILKLSGYLIDVASNSSLFGKTGSDAYSPSLTTLLDRLREKRLAPSRLPPGFLSAERMHARIHLRADEEAASRPLADYEDVYYALVARMQDMYQVLKLRMESGFNDSSHVVFDGGPSIAELHTSLSEYWDVFNSAGCGKALDDAVREARVQALRCEMQWQVENNHMATADAHEQLAQLYSADIYSGILGLSFIPDWAPAMVGALLELKYRPMLDLEKQEAAVTARLGRRRARMKERKKKKPTTTRGAPPTAPAETLVLFTHGPQEAGGGGGGGGVRKPSRESSTKARKPGLGHSKQRQEPGQDLVSPGEAPRQKKAHGPSSPMEPPSPPSSSSSSSSSRHPQQKHSQSAAPHSNQEHTYRAAHAQTLLLDWHAKTQRVSQYSDYLRARASQGAQHVVQGTRGGPTDSRGRGTVWGSSHADEDLSWVMDMEF